MAAQSSPKPTLSLLDAVGLIVGIVIGAGIFEVPSLVAANAGSWGVIILVWALGGVLSFIGGLCYAELATAYPDAGGTYYFLRRGFGPRLAFLYAWARLAVIQTGSIALLGFVFGDYASQIFNLGKHSSAIYAAMAVVLLTAANILGVQPGKWTQNLLTLGTVAGLIGIIVFGFFLSVRHEAVATAATASHSQFGLMMVFVLLTYGGWDEGAYLSAELKNVRRNMVLALLGSLAFITTMYVLVNLALLRGLGMAGMAGSKAVAAELMRRAAGTAGAVITSLVAMFAALSSMQATVFTGARTNFALGRDFPLFNRMGYWERRGETPTRALAIQGALALGLVLIGVLTREGFKSMVEYTAPVYWFFFTLSGVVLMVLRRKEPQAPRAFRVPGYPVTPILFSAMSAYLLYSSLAYTGTGAVVGAVVLMAGAVVLEAGLRWRPLARKAEPTRRPA